MAASWAVIWDSVCDFLHGKSQALSEASAVKPAIRGSPTYSQLFTARLKSCPDTKQSFFAAREGDTLPVCFLLERAPPLDGYYSCPVDEPHLWEALRYTELNPVRASLVAGAECRDWSSAAAHCGADSTGAWLAMHLWRGRWSAVTWRACLDAGVTES